MKEERRFSEPEWLVTFAVVLTLLHTWLSRTALSPDGVSYLDLARALSAGQWSSFVQGYWSPLYPVLLAIIAPLTGGTPLAMIGAAHLLNGAATIAAILLCWWWDRQLQRPFLLRGLVAALLLVSEGLPRIEAVTPDVVLLALMAWLGYELLVQRGTRPLRTGLLLGALFLAKTSSWPWLLLALPLRLWGARNAAGRRDVVLSSAVTAGVMLLWVVPMSVKAGHPTLGSTGRLNYGWYIESSDSRSPDTHIGTHAAYHEVPVDSVDVIEWAEFKASDRWTYEPWSDPTAWEAGVGTRVSTTPSKEQVLSYWANGAWLSFGSWLLPALLAVLLPWTLVNWRRGIARQLLTDDRPTLVVGLLGLAGIGQFILVHSEPRLIAPFGLLFAFAVLHQLTAETEQPSRVPTGWRRAASMIGLLYVMWAAGARLQTGIGVSAHMRHVIASIDSTNAALAQAGMSEVRIVVVGPAYPIEATAFVSGAHIVAQVPPLSSGLLASLPIEQQRRILATIAGGKAQIAWFTTSDAGIRMVAIPPK